MTSKRTLMVMCAAALLAATHAFSQEGPLGPSGPSGPSGPTGPANPIPPVFEKTWQNLTDPGAAVRVGDTIEFTIFYEHQCTNACPPGPTVSVTDVLDPGLLFLAFTQGSCDQGGGLIDCSFFHNCQDIGGPPWELRFTARVLALGESCNQALSDESCPGYPGVPTSASDDPAVPGGGDPTCFVATPAVPVDSVPWVIVLGVLLLAGLVLPVVRRSQGSAT